MKDFKIDKDNLMCLILQNRHILLSKLVQKVQSPFKEDVLLKNLIRMKIRKTKCPLFIENNFHNLMKTQKLQKKDIYPFKIQNLTKPLPDNLKFKVKLNKKFNHLNSRDIL